MLTWTSILVPGWAGRVRAGAHQRREAGARRRRSAALLHQVKIYEPGPVGVSSRTIEEYRGDDSGKGIGGRLRRPPRARRGGPRAPPGPRGPRGGGGGRGGWEGEGGG